MKKYIYVIIVLLIFTSCSNSSFIEKDGKIYYEWYHGGRFKKQYDLVQADPDSFEIITSPFAKDKNHVFYTSIIIEGADPGTYKLIKNSPIRNLAIDKYRLYLGTEPIPKSTAEGFELLGERGFFKDKNQAYLYQTTIDVCSVTNFRYVKDFWATDGCHYFWGWEKIPSNNYEKIILFNGGVAKDNQKVFLRGENLLSHFRKIEKDVDTIDASSFEEVSPFDGKHFRDKFGCILLEYEGRIECLDTLKF